MIWSRHSYASRSLYTDVLLAIKVPSTMTTVAGSLDHPQGPVTNGQEYRKSMSSSQEGPPLGQNKGNSSGGFFWESGRRPTAKSGCLEQRDPSRERAIGKELPMLKHHQSRRESNRGHPPSDHKNDLSRLITCVPYPQRATHARMFCYRVCIVVLFSCC